MRGAFFTCIICIILPFLIWHHPGGGWSKTTSYQFAAVENAYSIHDLVNYLFPREHKSSGATEKDMEENTFPVLARKKQQGQRCKRASKVSKVFDGLRSEYNGVTEIPERQKSSTSALAPEETSPVPLTLEEVALKHPVLEAKSRLTHWTNYAKRKSPNLENND